MNCDLVSGDEPSPWWSCRSRKSETFDRLARLAFGACPALLDLVGKQGFDPDVVISLTFSIHSADPASLQGHGMFNTT